MEEETGESNLIIGLSDNNEVWPTTHTLALVLLPRRSRGRNQGLTDVRSMMVLVCAHTWYGRSMRGSRDYP